MGHHVFIWRIKGAGEGSLEIKRNRFYNAPIGAAIFSMAPAEAHPELSVDENVYFTENPELLNYFDGKFYCTFVEYVAYTGMDAQGKEIRSYIREG